MGTVYTLNELIEKTGISEEELAAWENTGLLQPLGRSEDNIPFFGGSHIERIEQIRKFIELGYSPADIQKIIKKVGLPSSDGSSSRSLKKDELLTVGVLAEKTGISPRTIKHWEEKGIIEPDMRSRGGFRLYSKHYIYLASLIKDLQHFGYTLDEIKVISDYFRDFFEIKKAGDSMEPEIIEEKIHRINREIEKLFEKTALLKEGIGRWEDLIRKNRKELSAILSRSRKKMGKKEKSIDAEE